MWGAAFVVSEEEEIRFDLIYGQRSGRVCGASMGVIAAVAILVVYAGISLPAVVDYVSS